MKVKYRRTVLYGSMNIETEAYTAAIDGAADLKALSDTYSVSAGAIALKTQFEGRCEALFIVGGRQSIIESLRLQGSSPVIKNSAGTDALWAWAFRKKHTFGKNQTLIVISTFRRGIQAGGWEPLDRIDLREGSTSRFHVPYAEVSPAQLAEICESMFYAAA